MNYSKIIIFIAHPDINHAFLTAMADHEEKPGATDAIFVRN